MLSNIPLRVMALLTTAVFLLVACAGDDGDNDAQPGAESPSADPTAAGAVTATGSFELLKGHPDGYDNLSGRVTMTIGDEGSEGTITLTGMKPDTAYVAHVHEQSCDQDDGGPHFKFDPDGSGMPPNEIHWNFTSDSSGLGGATTSNPESIPEPGNRSVVVHENGHDDMGSADASGMDDHGSGQADVMGSGSSHAKIACADLA